jgi:hypothetical protein
VAPGSNQVHRTLCEASKACALPAEVIAEHERLAAS